MKRKRAASGASVPYKKPKKVVYKSKKRAVSIGEELKYNDVTVTGDVSTTPIVIALTTFASGDTALLRDGNKIICKSLEFKCLLVNETVASQYGRFVLVQCKQPNNAAPTWAGTPATSVFDADTVTARRNVSTASLYTILMDTMVDMNQTSAVVQQGYWKKYVKLPDVITLFVDGTSGIPQTNAYYLMYCGSIASGAGDMDCNGTARLRFVG